MKQSARRMSAIIVTVYATLLVASSPAAFAKKDKAKATSTGPDSVVLFIGNRMFPDFAEIVSARLRQRQAVGDSEFSFEIESFNPHFSIIDSTKKIVALSDEPKNPAFRIKVYKDDAAVDSTWAFYNMDIPHFSRTSALWFRVLAFDYRGQVFEKEPPKAPEQAPEKKK